MVKKIVNYKDGILDVLKGIGYAVLISLFLILIFALFVKFLSLGENVIIPVNYVIKVISIFLGCFWGIKHKKNGALKGLIIALLYYLLSILVFATLAGGFSMVKFNYIDVICLSLVGMICGIIVVNIKKDKSA